MNKKQRNAHKKKARIKARRKERRKMQAGANNALGMEQIMDLMKTIMGGDFDLNKLLEASQEEGGLESLLGGGEGNPLSDLLGGADSDLTEDEAETLWQELNSQAHSSDPLEAVELNEGDPSLPDDHSHSEATPSSSESEP